MTEFLFGVTVMPRPEVLDTQGRAVEETLKREGEPIVACRVGRFVEIKVNANSLAQAETVAQRVAESLLCNSLIETYRLKAIGDGRG